MIKIGTVLHGEEVDLGGGWSKPPKVIVTQTTLKTYDSAYAGDQTVSVGVDSLYRTPFIEEYRFVADISLRKSSHVQTTVVNDGIGPTALETWTSPVYTTPADAEEVTIAVGVKTQKGNGFNWNMRTIHVVIEYYDTDASSWEALSGVNDLVNDLKPRTYQITGKFDDPGTWEFRVVFTVADYEVDEVVSTFGEPEYIYSDETVSRWFNWTSVGDVESLTFDTSESPNVGVTNSIQFSPLTLTGEIYKVIYKFDKFDFTTQFTSPSPTQDNSAKFKAQIYYFYKSTFPFQVAPPKYLYDTTYSGTTIMSDTQENFEFEQLLEDNGGQPILVPFLNFGFDLNLLTTGVASFTINLYKDVRAQVFFRTLQETPTTPENYFSLISYEVITSGGILDTGRGMYIASDEN